MPRPAALDDIIAATEDPVGFQGVRDLVPKVFDRLSDPVLTALEQVGVLLGRTIALLAGRDAMDHTPICRRRV